MHTHAHAPTCTTHTHTRTHTSTLWCPKLHVMDVIILKLHTFFPNMTRFRTKMSSLKWHWIVHIVIILYYEIGVRGVMDGLWGRQPPRFKKQKCSGNKHLTFGQNHVIFWMSGYATDQVPFHTRLHHVTVCRFFINILNLVALII